MVVRVAVQLTALPFVNNVEEVCHGNVLIDADDIIRGTVPASGDATTL